MSKFVTLMQNRFIIREEMEFHWCLISIVIWYFIVEGNSIHKAFIYNQKRYNLISLPNNLLDLNCDYWVVACSAKYDDERDFEDEYSLYNEALYLQKYYNFQSSCSDLDKALCDKPFEISMTYSRESKKIEFGYEIFHETMKLRNVSPLPFENFYPIKKYKKAKSKLFAAAIGVDKKTFNDEMQKRKNTELRLHGFKMEFLWIPLVRVKMHSEHFQNVEYEIRKNNTNPMLKCYDYSLGNEMRNSEVVDFLYSNEKQKMVFEKVTIPIRMNESDEVPEGTCEPEYQCLIKWPLLPTDQFQFGSDSPLKCSNITTIPIWRSTLERIMEKLDKYLYALYRISGQPLRVLAGVHQELELPKINGWLNKNVNLEQEKLKILAPKIIYKMVKFKLNPCEGKNCWYGILIVIHNGPYIAKKDLICEDQSANLGWEEIKRETWNYAEAQSKFIYVCEISKETMKSVDLTYIKDTNFVPLSLLEFPLFNTEKQLKFKLINEKVSHEMDRLSKPGEKVELDGSLIERPSLDDNFGSTDGEDFVYPDDEEGDVDSQK